MANEDRVTYIETNTRGSGATWVIAIVLVIALAIGVVFFSRMSSSETAKDNAVASAANSVGNAAKDVGDSAREATNEK